MVVPQPLQSGRYAIEIDSVLVAFFQDCSGLSVEVTTQEYVEGGNNRFVRRLPAGLKYGNITLKRGLSDNSQFLDWRPKVENGAIKIKRKTVSIKVLSHAGETIKQWDVTNAWPVKWTGPDFRATSMEVAIESIELAHEGWREVK